MTVVRSLLHRYFLLKNPATRKWRGNDARRGCRQGGTITTSPRQTRLRRVQHETPNRRNTVITRPRRMREIRTDADATNYPISCHATTVDRLWIAALINNPAPARMLCTLPPPPATRTTSFNHERAATHRVPRWRARTESRPGGTAATCAAPSRDAPRSGSQASRSRNRIRRPIRRTRARANHA